MLLLDAKDIRYQIGTRKLLDEISFRIYKGDKIGLVGRNGSGKTTLLKIIKERIKDYRGVIKTHTSRIAYLPQHYNYLNGYTTVEEFLTEDSNNYGAILENMNKFGLDSSWLDRRIKTCSGGEQTRLQLIKLLITRPELLLLDEPTNHLDHNSRIWLQEFTANFSGGVLVVSHDRQYLDDFSKKIWELERGELSEYRGNFSDYREKKKEQRKIAHQKYEKFQKEKKRLQAAIRRQQKFVNKADSGRKKTDSFWRQLKGQDGRTGQMAHRVKALQGQLKQLENREKPYEHKEVNLELVPQKQVHSSILISGQGVSKNFGELELFSGLDFRIEKGAKIALIGPNGSGKTVLLRLITGREQPSGGKINSTASIRMGYVSQKLKNLEPQQTVLQAAQAAELGQCEQKIRTFLGSMLFTQEKVEKKINQLSLGERVRLSFVRLLLSGSNFLILDEPLNHMDLFARERIEEALKKFTGTILFVTHDRYFMKKIASEIWNLKEGSLNCFQGSFEDFQHKQKSSNQALSPKSEEKKENKQKSYTELQKKMKKAELIARLSGADEQKKKEINRQLDKLD